MSDAASEFSIQVLSMLYKRSNEFQRPSEVCLPSLRIHAVYWKEIYNFVLASIPDEWEVKMGPLRGVISIQSLVERDPEMRDVA